MKNVQPAFCLLAITMFSATVLSSARADTWDKKTVVTFNQAVEVPGKVLPAGTYTFQLLDSPSDRHIVQIFSADGTHIITTILAINNYRLEPTGETVMRFSERPGDSPDALKAWFYPGDNFGQEFVYPKSRATELALALKEPVPALEADTTDLNTVAIVAVTPEKTEVPVTEAVETTAPATETVKTTAPVANDPAPAPAVATAELPRTASIVP